MGRGELKNTSLSLKRSDLSDPERMRFKKNIYVDNPLRGSFIPKDQEVHCMS